MWWQLSLDQLQKMSYMRLFVLCFRSRDPSEAAAHRQEGGGCFQLSSYRVGKTNTFLFV